MTEEEIIAKAQQMAEQHKQDMINTRTKFVQECIDKGYNFQEWTVCDNLLDIKAGHTFEYKVWLRKNNPTDL